MAPIFGDEGLLLRGRIVVDMGPVADEVPTGFSATSATASAESGMALPGLVVRNLHKAFPGQVALDGVDLHLRPGEVHALVGQNGSGKSTLIKILAGFHQPDRGGEAWLHGEKFELGSAPVSHQAGLRFIHQDLGLVTNMDVVDNLALGGGYEARWWLSARRERAAARALLQELGLHLEVSKTVRQLTSSERTMVAVARSLRGGLSSRGVLVLDEPTASLPGVEVGHLFELVRTVASRGAAVLYVTHRLAEVFEIADRVTVLRDGRIVLSAPVSQVSHDEMVRHIVGRPLDEFYSEPPEAGQETSLEVERLRTPKLRGVSFEVRKGEILGFAGLTGSGREDIAPALFGALTPTAGDVSVQSRPIDPLSPKSAIAAGIAYLPSDRKRESAIPSFNVRENLTLPRIATQLGWLGYRRERVDSEKWLSDLDVRPTGTERAFATLSGGNQQKVVLARWLRCASQVLLLDEPTQGVDVGAKATIYQALTEAARQGRSLVVTSSDNEELAQLCDRVIVLSEGVIRAELSGSNLSEESISLHALASEAAA